MITLDDLWGEEAEQLSAVPCEKTEEGSFALARGAVGRVTLAGNDTLYFESIQQSFPFQITDAEQKQLVMNAIQQRYAVLASFSSNAGRRFQLHVVPFLRRVNFLNLQVILTARVRKQLGIHGYDVKDDDHLAEAFQFEDGMQRNVRGEDSIPCFAFLRASEDDLVIYEKKAQKVTGEESKGNDETGKNEVDEKGANESENGQAQEEGQRTNQENSENFSDIEESSISSNEEKKPQSAITMQIMGKDCLLFVRIEGTGLDSHAVAYRVTFSKPQNSGILHLQLADGKLSFSDEKSYVSSRVKDILQSSPSYIKIWNDYAKKEGDFLLARARVIGTITYQNHWNATKEGAELILTPGTDISHLKIGDRLEVRPTPPPWIEDPDMSWESYVDWRNLPAPESEDTISTYSNLGENTEEEEKPKRKYKRKAEYFPSYKISGIREGHITVEGDTRALELGNPLYYSISGDEKQIDRRETARKRIETGQNASPKLGLILGSDPSDAGKSISFGSENRKHIDPRPKKKIFKNDPTINQMMAIDTALNTPDIAVIQGPPGTGKTTVITGIIERLNELSANGERQPGQVLVTSLQHDAVNNIIERIDEMPINSLPTIKFGQKASEKSQTVEDTVTSWCEEKAEMLEAKHPELKETAQEQELFAAFHRYQMNPDDTHAAAFLNTAHTLARDEKLIKGIEEILNSLHTETQMAGYDRLIRKIYRLRTTPEVIADDGEDTAFDLYNELESLYGERPTEEQQAHLDLLKEAAISGSSADEELLDKLYDLQQVLLREARPPIQIEPTEPREDILEIYSELRKSLERPENVEANVIYDFYWALRDNPETVRKAVASYSFVFAATAQQSERSEIKRAKGLKPRDDTVASYDTVIVDEAARVTPGDLMIPLSQASGRIILVGDQRQLPHIYDEEIFQELKEEGKLENEDDVTVSMFEHLWEKAKSLEKLDGIKRTVTLDQQFRMHPLLGDFISGNFYEVHDRSEGFSSPLPAENFRQPVWSEPVRWDHIAAKYGNSHRTPSRSLVRDCEVTYIVKLLKKYLNNPEYNALTFGVISFYRGQADRIKQLLQGNDYGSRLRIGTVDEFQGMEFDVIILSTVRSGIDISGVDIDELYHNPAAEDKKKHDSFVENTGRRIYGFLTDNRLCVALSRQKRLLIIVGDADMYRGDAERIAEKCAPAMFNMYELCKAKKSVLNIKL